MPGFELLGIEEKNEVMDVMNRGVLFRYEFQNERQGVWKVREFEESFARYTGAGYAQAVSSGTAALKVALLALGVGPGDEVIVPAFTFVASWEAVLDAGAIPVFAEIDETLGLDPEDLKKRITPKTKAVIAVHMLGAMARIDKIVEAAGSIPVIEDTAQSCGGFYKGRHLGNFGKLGTFSFDSVKTLTTGEGGMVITSDLDLWTRSSEYHDHGHDHKPVGRGNESRNFFGFNYRMMELQGALGLAQLRKLPFIVESQRANKKRLKDHLAKIPGVGFRPLPDESGDTATFLIFSFESAEKAAKFNEVLGQNNAGAVCFVKNNWHYYGKWEQLIEQHSPFAGGFPFKQLDGGRAEYPADAFPRTTELLARHLVWPINIKMSEADFTRLTTAADKAASAL